MTAVNEFERPGVEKLASDFFELAISLVDRKDVDLDTASLDRLHVTFEVMSVAIEREKEIRAAREETANIFEERVLGISPVQITSEISDLPVIDQTIEAGLLDQLDVDNDEVREAKDRVAAEAVSSLVLGETVSRTEITDKTDTTETASSQQVSNGEAETVLSEQLTAEERFILDQLGEVQPGEQVGKSFFFDRGFNSVNDRASKIAYSQAFVNAMKFLVEKGAVVKPSRQSYVLAEGSTAFLAQ
jgi:hypothetical protein